MRDDLLRMRREAENVGVGKENCALLRDMTIFRRALRTASKIKGLRKLRCGIREGIEVDDTKANKPASLEKISKGRELLT
jgi:hypothetical protein